MKRRLSKIAVGYWLAIALFILYRVALAVAEQRNVLSAVNIPGVAINALFLNGLVPVYTINNTIVNGGWYVGTSVILYALFPLAYRLYFGDAPKWQRCRAVVFPLVVFCGAALAIAAVGLVHPIFACTNNSFMYFSFVNQLTPFVLGMVLYDIWSRMAVRKWTLWISLAALLLSVALFFGAYRYSFVFVPTLFALAVMLLLAYSFTNGQANRKIEGCTSGVAAWIIKCGKMSFSIYLTHSFVAFDFSALMLMLLKRVHPNTLMWYAVLLPIEILLCYAIGHVFHKVVTAVEKRR